MRKTREHVIQVRQIFVEICLEEKAACLNCPMASVTPLIKSLKQLELGQIKLKVVKNLEFLFYFKRS